MKKGIYELVSNNKIADDMYLARFAGDTSCFCAPGQFVNIELPGCFLRRPFSICDWGDDWLDIAYKVVGKGTDILSRAKPGEKLDVLAGLGNGFDVSVNSDSPLLVGGGSGVPPLYGLAKRLAKRKVTVILGFNSAKDAFFIKEFETLGCSVLVSTADGSLGIRGLVTDAVKDLRPRFDYVFACGPLPMLKAICDISPFPGQYSLETRMACGFGACMGCAFMTKNGAKRICRDGPVFKGEEIIW
jgi:dihydroorotate dehydrogenase electron transfer subunit